MYSSDAENLLLDKVMTSRDIDAKGSTPRLSSDTPNQHVKQMGNILLSINRPSDEES